jgi:PAS domain S-box-containing protein
MPQTVAATAKTSSLPIAAVRASARRSLSSVARPREWDREDEVDQTALQALASTAAGAFAIDANDRVIFWSEGAEKLLGHRASDVMGRACFELLAGCDPFGNRYCGAHCPIVSLMREGIEPEPFFMDVKKRDGARVKVRIRTVALPNAGPGFRALVHLLDPGDVERIEKVVAELRASTRREKVAEPLPLPTLGNPLTTREREIVQLLSEGFAALNIAARLNLSHATVRNHIQNILRKLEVHSQVEAISVAFRKGWL